MSGIMMAAIGKISPPASPLSISASVQGGSVPVGVSVPSGVSDALPDGGSRIFQAAASGGTPPYSYKWERQNSGTKTTLESATGFTAYMSWTGFVVGEYQSVTARCKVTDDAGVTATSNTIVIGIRRDS